VEEQLRKVPRRGIGYGLLRYSSGEEDLSRQLASLPAAQVSFNYLGQIDEGIGAGLAPGHANHDTRGEGPGPETGTAPTGTFTWADESAGEPHSSRARRAHLIDVNAQITRGRLELEFTYSKSAHRRATVEELASDYRETLAAIVAHCQTPEAGGYTPSDFPDVNLDQEMLDKLMSRLRRPDRRV